MATLKEAVKDVEVIEYIFRGIANSRRRILTCSLDERHRVTPTARASEPVNAVAVVWVTVSARGREKAPRVTSLIIWFLWCALRVRGGRPFPFSV